MKKLLLVSFLAIAGLSSCKKDYNCKDPNTGAVVVAENASKDDIDKLESMGLQCEKK